MPVDYHEVKRIERQFHEHVRYGRLVQDDLVVPPPLMTDWPIYIDGEKTPAPAKIPQDGQEHTIELFGPEGFGHVWTTVKTDRPKPRLIATR